MLGEFNIFWAIYLVAGWWAVNRTIYANKELVGNMQAIFVIKLLLSLLLGWILIPVAVYITFFKK